MSTVTAILFFTLTPGPDRRASSELPTAVTSEKTPAERSAPSLHPRTAKSGAQEESARAQLKGSPLKADAHSASQRGWLARSPSISDSRSTTGPASALEKHFSALLGDPSAAALVDSCIRFSQNASKDRESESGYNDCMDRLSKDPDQSATWLTRAAQSLPGDQFSRERATLIETALNLPTTNTMVQDWLRNELNSNSTDVAALQRELVWSPESKEVIRDLTLQSVQAHSAQPEVRQALIEQYLLRYPEDQDTFPAPPGGEGSSN